MNTSELKIYPLYLYVLCKIQLAEKGVAKYTLIFVLYLYIDDSIV